MKNIKIILFSIVLCTIVCFANAQEIASFHIQYKLTYVIDTTQPESPDIAYFSLFLGKNSSKYVDYVDPTNSNMSYTKISNQPLYKYIETNTMIREIQMPQIRYAITELIPVIAWSLGKEQRKILGYKCQSATGTFRGRNYTAWFTPQLSYKNGPWKFGGLPGLILEIYDQKKEIIWEAQSGSLAIDEGLKIIQPNKNGIKVSEDEFKKLNEAIARDAGAVRGSVTDRPLPPGVTVTVVPKNAPNGRNYRRFNNPIEKN